jgi:hypothetical protein
MGMMCEKCFKNHKKNGWYIGFSDKKIKDEKKCDYHPVLSNWRVTRTLRSLIYWSKCGENYRHPHATGMRLCLSFGRIHRGTAEAILYDYESPFIDLLIEAKYLEQEENFDGVTRALRILPESDTYLKKTLTVEKYEAFKEELRQLALKDIQPAEIS